MGMSSMTSTTTVGEEAATPRMASLPHVQAVTAALMERTPFAIDDAIDDDEDSLAGIGGEDDDQVMDEVNSSRS